MALDRELVRRALDAWLPAFLEGRRGPTDVYVPMPMTWHAATGRTSYLDPHMDDPSYARLRRLVPDLRREDTRVSPTDDGWVLQTTTVGTVDGEEVRVHACLVVHLDAAGRIERFDEYSDAAQAAPFARLLGAD